MKINIRRILTSKYFLIPLAALLFYTLAGFVLAPLAVRWYVPKYARDQLKCQAGIGKVRINPFLFKFEVNDFSLAQADGSPLAGFGRLFFDFEISSLVHWAAMFRELRLENPELHLVVEEDGGLNLAKLVPRSEKPETDAVKPADSKPFRMVLHNASIGGGDLTLTDKRQSTPANLSFHDLDLNLQDLSTLQDQNGTYSLSAKTPGGESFLWQGRIALAPFASSGKMALNGIRAATLWEFFRDSVNLESPTGTLDASTEYHLDASASPMQLSLERSRLELSKLLLKLVGASKPLLELNKLELDSANFNLVSRALQVGKLLVDGGALQLRIDEAGRSNLEQIVSKTPAKDSNEAQPAQPAAAPQSSTTELPPWTVNVDAIEIKDIAFALDDVSRAAPLNAAVSSIGIRSKAKIEAGAANVQVFFSDISTELKLLKLVGASKPLLELNKLELDSADFNLASRALQVGKLLVDGGALQLHVDEAGRSNLEQIVSKTPGKESDEAQPAQPAAAPQSSTTELPPWTVNVDSIEIKNIAFSLDDLSRATPFNAAVSSVGIRSKAKIEAGAANVQVLFSDISTELKAIQLGATKAAAPLFRTEELTVMGADFDLGARTVTVSNIALNDGRMDVSRDGEGRINWAQLFAPGSGAPGKAGSKPTAGSGSPWKFLLKTIELNGFRSALSDFNAYSDKPVFNLQALNVRLTDVDGKSPMGFEVNFQVEQGGKVALHGKVDPSTPSVQTECNVEGLVLTPLQPYLEPYITLVLRSAAVSTQGTLRYKIADAGSDLNYEGNFSLDKLSLSEPDTDETYLGWDDLEVPQLKLTLAPNALQIDEIKLSKPVGELIIAEDGTVNLARVLKQEAGEGKSSASSETASKEAGDGFAFSIGKVRLADGRLLFADLSLQPKFSARIHDLKGTIGKLSSEKNTRAQVHLDGRVDRYGLARIRGVLDLYDIKRSTDINVVFRNVEMTSLTPYSGRFAGRRIESGKLSTDLKYKIQNNKLVGDNQIIVDNLVLGEHVDSPDAVNLPLDLAIALLKDTSGRIDIGLPVSGDLNDPKFSLGPLIRKAFVNLITKIVTAPFRALGALFGGEGEQFDMVEFEPGTAELLPPEQEKLKKLADALKKRPELKLVVQGRYSPEADGMVFKELYVRRAVAAQMGAKLGPDEDPGQLDFGDPKTESTLENMYEERFGKPALEELEQAVKEGKIKPRAAKNEKEDNAKRKKRGRFTRIVRGLKLYKLVPGAKSPEQAQLMAGEIYARLVEKEPVEEKTLLQLAEDRSRAITAELESAGGIAADRLLPKAAEPPVDDAEPIAKLSLDALAAAQ